jgi:DDE superfamily endonuclease
MTIVNDLLKQMPGLCQPQRKFLATLFVTILVLRGRVNFRNLSRYCDYSERTIARQFREPFDWPDFHQRVLMMALDPHSELISAHDASFIPKSGKQTFGLGHFFNGCASRAERGLEISTLAVVEVTRRCAFTLAVAQTPPGEDATKAEQEETRVDFYKQQLRARIGIACRRASTIIVWTATMRRRNILMKSAASICTPSPNCGATPTVYFSTPVRTRSDVGQSANMMGRSTSQPCTVSRTSEQWQMNRICICLPPWCGTRHFSVACALWSSSTGKTRPSHVSLFWARLIRI